MTKAAAVTGLNQPDYQRGQEERKHFTASDKLDESFWDFASLRDDVDREKDDKVTQVFYLLALALHVLQTIILDHYSKYKEK